MAKGKGGGNNNYRPQKNQELLSGKPDNRTPAQIVKDGKKETVKQDHESWPEQAKRTTPEVKPSFSDRFKQKQNQSTPSKDINKTEPDKDK
jgi:hypothetical protein